MCSSGIFRLHDLHKLCDTTIVNEPLLTILETHRILVESTKENIKSQVSNYEKAAKLYEVLKKRPADEKELIVEILRETTNETAARIIEDTETDVQNQEITEWEVISTPFPPTQIPLEAEETLIRKVYQAIVTYYMYFKGYFHTSDT